MAAVEARLPGWVVRVASLGGTIPAVACRVRRVVLVDPELAPTARRSVVRLLHSL